MRSRSRPLPVTPHRPGKRSISPAAVDAPYPASPCSRLPLPNPGKHQPDIHRAPAQATGQTGRLSRASAVQQAAITRRYINSRAKEAEFREINHLIVRCRTRTDRPYMDDLNITSAAALTGWGSGLSQAAGPGTLCVLPPRDDKSAEFVGEADEAVSAGQQVGDRGGNALGCAALGVVHVADHDGTAGGGGDGAADLPGVEGGSPVAVDGELTRRSAIAVTIRAATSSQ